MVGQFTRTALVLQGFAGPGLKKSPHGLEKF